MLCVRCVGWAYVDHGPAGPRLRRQVEETAGVVLDDVKPALAGADVEVAVNPDAKGRAADLWPRGARHRSEESRVGKECASKCRSRRLPYPKKKTKITEKQVTTSLHTFDTSD